MKYLEQYMAFLYNSPYSIYLFVLMLAIAGVTFIVCTENHYEDKFEQVENGGDDKLLALIAASFILCTFFILIYNSYFLIAMAYFVVGCNLFSESGEIKSDWKQKELLYFNTHVMGRVHSIDINYTTWDEAHRMYKSANVICLYEYNNRIYKPLFQLPIQEYWVIQEQDSIELKISTRYPEIASLIKVEYSNDVINEDKKLKSQTYISEF